MINQGRLLADLKSQVNLLEADLRVRLRRDLPEVRARLAEEHAMVRRLGQSSATLDAWLNEKTTQTAVAWVLAIVFVRFCEDNGLLSEPRSAPHDHAGSRHSGDWTLTAFEKLDQGGIARLLFEPDRDLALQIPISDDAAGGLAAFWGRSNEDGSPVHDFTDPEWDTRFLVDLYQNLSDSQSMSYGLLPTPGFVVQFILDRTLTPAIRDFGCDTVQMIDPACGSGGFVIESFHRILAQRGRDFPTADRVERVRRAADAVHGTDINPSAVVITRFRLVVAAMKAAGLTTLTELDALDVPVHIAVGDALLKAESSDSILTEGRYHVVVGNPPFLTVRDKARDSLYRRLYGACTGKYSLSVPFAERFFQLAKPHLDDDSPSGYVGQLMPNSIAKRGFGATLIEDFFAQSVELSEIIDSSGAYIPGHGMPTMIVVGRRRQPRSTVPVRLVVGLRGEPTMPESPSRGLVWRAIVTQVDRVGSTGDWVAVEDVPREEFAKSPWVLSDRDSRRLLDRLASGTALSEQVERIGYIGVTGADDVFVADPRALRRARVEHSAVVRILTGSAVRDWGVDHTREAFLPYNGASLLDLSRLPVQAKRLWPYRTTLAARQIPGTSTGSGRAWYSWTQHFPVSPGKAAVAYAWVATHPHFALLDPDLVPLQSAPVIVFPEGTDQARIFDVLGVLNSSCAAFWLRSTGMTKGGGSDVQFADEVWTTALEIAGTRLLEFPLPADCRIPLSREMDELARQFASAHPSAVVEDARPSERLLEMARAYREGARARMIALQEEIDWHVYRLYGILSEDLSAPEGTVPGVNLGERAFEIVLARKIAAGESSSSWFVRHGSRPITEVPAHWPEAYRRVVQHRIDAIESSRAVNELEQPAYKRRWHMGGWDALEAKALRSWLLERMEDQDLWFERDEPRLRTLSQLIEYLSHNSDFVAVAALYAPHAELAEVVSDLLEEEHVPHVSALRYKASGLSKHTVWEGVWEQQRAEIGAGDAPTRRDPRDAIAVPPTYTSADFAKQSYWSLRGKFDMPNERFISYGTALGPPPEVYGWAGWDHWQQAHALTAYISRGPVERDEIVPMLAGALELQPWLDQWHGEFDPVSGAKPADLVRGFVDDMKAAYGLTDEELRGWRPPPPRRGRPPKKSAK
ncbi:MAG TPA: BREX-2 system adenine-specific DNA-methyltransferase PglX [Actinocrinis sp.]|nr:BREX-2 system adenine-specific DNA-methyltransferase PglX [Actinocrinis sp.]